MFEEKKEEIASLVNEEVETIVPDIFCIYCRKSIDKDREPYTVVKNREGLNAWHYMCFERDHTEVISMSHKTKIELGKHLILLRDSGSTERWVKKVLRACGYK